MSEKQLAYSLKVISILVLFAAGLLIPSGAAKADHGPVDFTTGAAFDQKINALAPLDLSFLDESGRRVALERYFVGKPVILVFAYYECPMLCTLVLNDLTRSLKEINFSAGDEFEVVVVSIDHLETPEMAAAKKAAYLAEYGRQEAENGWHFLTGEQESIQNLAQAVGFRYSYDEHLDQYAHPAGITVLTPEGRVSRYFFGIRFSSMDLRLGLIEAAQRKIGTVVDQVYLLCYDYDPVTGRYSLLVTGVLRLAGLATVVIMGGTIGGWLWRERRAHKSISRG